MITVIPNQPIRLRESNSISTDCDCLGQRYCQLINKFDNTQFQIKSSNLVTNGTFTSNLDGWNVYLSITVEIVSLMNATFEECDGSIVVSASGGTGPYEYSIDGGAFQVSGTFTGLCPGNYYITVVDSEGNEGALFFGITEGIDCSLYAGSDANDVLLLDSATTINCFANDFI